MVRKKLRIIIPVCYAILMIVVVLSVWNWQSSIRRGGESPLYRNLMDYPAYVRRGFDRSGIGTVPAAGSAQWRRFNGPPLRIMNSSLPDLPRRIPFSVKGRVAEEFTILIAFEIDRAALGILQGEPSIVPGLFFACIGDNWEVYLNGTLLRTEMHLSAEGKIMTHRTWRDVHFPIDKGLLTEGANVLALRIVGDPAYDGTGLYYTAPNYLDNYTIIEKRQRNPLITALCGIFGFTGVYHLLMFALIKRRREFFNLYYGLFSVLLCVYTLARNNTIYQLIHNSNITVRLEYAALFMAIPMMGLFVEFLLRQKITRSNWVYTAFCFCLSVSQIFFSNQYGDDALQFWSLSTMAYFLYIFIADILYCYIWGRRKRRTENTADSAGMAGGAVINIVISVMINHACGTVDVLDVLFFHQALNLFQYSVFVVNIGIAITLSDWFSSLYNRLDESHKTLEAAVQERTLELEKQTAIAVKASRAKSEFLATMSHEIRTPLNAIIGLSEIELQGNPPRESRTNLEHIYHSGSSLLGIVNNILDISKIEAGSFELVPVEYETSLFISDTVNINKVRIGSRPIVFVLEMGGDFPRKLLGDEVRVKRILNNILSNAIKYTRQGSVTLSIGWENRGGTALIRFVVRDTGIGIRPEDMEKLFSDYTQLDSKANRKIEGTGLGLAITRKLVEMMGGTINVESEYGKGSVFTVELVQGIADAQAIGEETVESLRSFRYVHEGKNRAIVRAWMPYGKVLVVDDMPVNLQVARGLLAPYGLRVDTAGSGREAIALLQKTDTPYDLVFMDHMMPEMDGIEAVRIIREWENAAPDIRAPCGQVPIIALTANALIGIKGMFLSNGFSGYISKPIDSVELDTALNKWVRDKQSAEILRRAEAEKAARQDTEKHAARLPETAVVEGLDLARGREQYGSDEAYIPILHAYLVHTKPVLEKIRNPARDSLAEYTVLVHGLKGSSYGICAAGIGGKAAELEAAARRGDYERIMADNAAFIAAVESLLGELQALLRDTEDRAAAKPKAPAPDSALLARLRDEAKRYRAGAMEETLNKLEAYEYEQGGELVAWLRTQMDNLEYDAIQQKLEVPGVPERPVAADAGMAV
jgi:signal transduction histidine kinase/DNA-binding response OmpR family regulator